MNSEKRNNILINYAYTKDFIAILATLSRFMQLLLIRELNWFLI